MKKDFIGIQDCVIAVSKTKKFRQTSLKKKRELLDDAQDILSRYGIELRYLDIQKHTIEINLQNYQKRLGKIRNDAQKEACRQPALAEKDFPTDLKFLETFSKEMGESYLMLVQKDYDNLSPGLVLL
jgi:ethanolamine utilization cobalamin adenosyltransferase